MNLRIHDRTRWRRAVRGSAAAATTLLLAVGCRAPSGDRASDRLATAHPGSVAPAGPRGTSVVPAARSDAPEPASVVPPRSAVGDTTWPADLPRAGAVGTGPSEVQQSNTTGDQSPLAADLSVDVRDGDFPRLVVFDAAGSALGDGDVTYEWSFGDGTVTRDGPTTVHTYTGAGEFVATLTLADGTGRRSAAEVTIDVSTPDCPDDQPPLTLGEIDDDSLDETSGIAASRIEPGAYWLHGDVDQDRIVAVDLYGNTLSEHDLPSPLLDFEDLEAVVDPVTGAPLLFLADIGDNDAERSEIALWIVEEPDPLVDGDLDPMRVRLTYPPSHGPLNAETLLVDPFTLDAFVITKGGDDEETEVFVKRAPHEEGGPFELEALGTFDALDFMTTGGAVSPDGLEVVVRGYGDTAQVWIRDGYRPLEEVFEEDPCEVDIQDEDQGEAVTFTIDGRGLVTTSEGEGEPVYFIGL